MSVETTASSWVVRHFSYDSLAKVTLVVVFSAAFVNAGYSQTVIKSAVRGQWGSDATWDLNRQPTANDSVVIAHNVSVGTTITANAGEINILSGGTLNIAGGLVNANSIENSGSVNLGTLTARIVAGDMLNAAEINMFAGAIELSGHLINESSSVFIGGGALQIAGDLRNYVADLDLTAIPVSFDGNTLQQIVGNIKFSDMTVMPGAKVALADGASVTLINRITLEGSGASFDANTSGDTEFVLVSASDGPAGNASIAPIPPDAIFTGNVTVQRFISSAGNRVYRYLSSPVNNATVSQWQQSFAITGGFAGASTFDPETGLTTVCNYPIISSKPSMYYYDNAADNPEYVAFPTSNSQEELQPGVGYAAFIRQQCNSSVTVSVTGSINQGRIELPISHNTNTPEGESWNLVGNPYPSTVDWNAAGWEKTGVADVIAVQDNGDGGSGQYVYSGLEGSYNGLIATGQGFWVRTNGSDAELWINEDAKSTATGSFYREGPKDEIILSLENGSITDLASYRIRPDAETGLDRYDAPKLNNYQDLVGEVFDLATLSPDEEGKAMAINAVPAVDGCDVTVNVLTKDMANGSYTFSLKASGLMTGYQWVLKDHLLDKEIELTEEAQYTFSVSDEASGATDRFTLVGHKQIAPVMITVSEEDEHTLVSSYGKGNQWYFNGTLIPGATAQSITATETGLYEVAVSTDGCVSRTAREMIILAAEDGEDGGYELYPNPVEDRLTIVLPHTGNATGIVLSTFGKTLGDLRFEMSDGRKSAVYDFSGQPAGLYVVKIRQGNTTHHYKIVKQ